MRINLGYVAISKTLDFLTTSSTYTYTLFEKEKDYKKLDAIIKSNLEALIEILKYNYKNQIHFYRISSNLIPLSTKKEVQFNYLDTYNDYYEKISKILEESSMRVDFHPSAYCVLNSVKKEVVESSIQILEYHYQLLNYMKIKNKIIILHIGSSTFGKKNSLSRFINQFMLLPDYLKEVIAIENDDKVFTIEDCLFLSKKLHIPVVLDYHHFICNHESNDINLFFKDIFASWTDRGLRPKIHFSSPKNKKEFRSHHDYIDADEFINFLNIICSYNQDIDIMLEAKAKDDALFRLVRQLKYKTNYKFIDDTSFEIT